MHHHKRDWSKYNRELVNRGKLHFWVRPKTQWRVLSRKKNGHPFVYADEAIKAMLYIRFKLHLSLRELEGFFISLMEMSRKAEKVPCYTLGLSKDEKLVPSSKTLK